MSKKAPPELLQEGEALLTAWGVGPDADPAALEPLRGRAVAADLAIVQRLARHPTQASADLLDRLAAETQAKVVRKEARRALYGLAQRFGIRPTPRPGPPPAAAPAAPPLEGYLSPVDGRGDQLVWVVRPGAGGLRALLALVNDPGGLRDLDFQRMSRKAFKALLQEAERRIGFRMVTADGAYADYLIARASRWAEAGGRPTAREYRALRAQLGGGEPPAALPPLITARWSPQTLREDPQALARSRELVGEREFASWLFDSATLRPYLDALAAVRESPLVLTEAQQREREAQVLERALEELFGDPGRESWVRRLYEMAYYLSRTDRLPLAQAAGAAAATLEASPAGGRGIPFCEELLRVSLAFALEATLEAEAARRRTSLIVTPQDLRRSRPRR